MNVTERLARWVADVEPIDTPIAVSRAVDAVRDTVACMVAGAGDEAAHAVRETVAGYGPGPATVVGARDGAPAPWAALANGMSAHVLDYDDNYLPGLTHASAVLVPALIALAEERGASGRQVIDAYIVGLEAHAVLGRGMGRTQYDLGWHSTSTIGCVGTAAACARLLGLDQTGVVNAISLGVSMASGAKVQFGSPGKPFHAGMAAHDAVLAATLAAAGVQGRPDAIEGERGFRDLYAGDPDSDWAALLDGLGKPPAIESFGLAPKLYPCCGSAHKVLDGVLALRAAHGFEAADVASVEALVGHGNQRNLCYPDPRQEMEARFSLNYCVAVALLHGRVVLADFTPRAVQRAAVRRLMPLVSMRARAPDAQSEDPTERQPHEVTITLQDGQVLSKRITWARGTLHNPFGPADVAAKFQDCCEGFLAPEDFAAARDALGRLAAIASVGDLTRHLRFDAGGDRGERFDRGVCEAAD